MARVALTGATGELGRRVAQLVAPRFADDGTDLVLLARAPERLPAVEGAESRRISGYADREGLAQALRDVDVMFLVSAAESADRLSEHEAAVDAAVDAGVQHVVYTSFLGASPESTFTLARTHFHTEERIRDSGVGFTFLRDNLYLDVLPLFAGEDGVIRGPAGTGRLSGIARDDVAAVAAEVLADPAAHRDTTYDLTGREAITMAEAAAVISERTGREVRFEDETLEEAYASRAKWNPEDWQADAWVSTYTAIASGELAPISDDVRRVTGRDPMTLAELLSAWPGSSS